MHALGTLDALLSLAAVAKLPGYVRPLYRLSSSTNPEDASAEGVRHVGGDARQGNDTGVDLDAIELRGARHPTVERVLEGGFVPNDVHLRCALRVGFPHNSVKLDCNVVFSSITCFKVYKTRSCAAARLQKQLLLS